MKHTSKCHKCGRVHQRGAPCLPKKGQNYRDTFLKKRLKQRGSGKRLIARPIIYARDRRIIRRDSELMCAGCGKYSPDGEVDHIVSIALGGDNDWENLQWLCKPCHNVKSGQDSVKLRQLKKRQEVLGF